MFAVKAPYTTSTVLYENFHDPSSCSTKRSAYLAQVCWINPSLTTPNLFQIALQRLCQHEIHGSSLSGEGYLAALRTSW